MIRVGLASSQESIELHPGLMHEWQKLNYSYMVHSLAPGALAELDRKWNSWHSNQISNTGS